MWTRKAIKMIFSFALLFFGAVCQTLSCIQEENVHSNFFLSKPSSKVVGHVIRTTFAHSFLTCAQFCSREPRCVSLNYKDNLDMEGKSVCELNSERAITSALVHDNSFSYAAMECVSFKCFSCFYLPFSFKMTFSIGFFVSFFSLIMTLTKLKLSFHYLIPNQKLLSVSNFYQALSFYYLQFILCLTKQYLRNTGTAEQL